MGCCCTSEEIHTLLKKAHLCGPINSLSEPPSSRDLSPQPQPNSTKAHSPGLFSILSLNRRAQSKRKHREKFKRQQKEKLNGQKFYGVVPKFVKVSGWHLDKGRRSSSGYRGISMKICESIPHIPLGSDGQTQLEIFKKNGYELVPAPVFVFLTMVNIILTTVIVMSCILFSIEVGLVLD
jgi:hypothetical protein